MILNFLFCFLLLYARAAVAPGPKITCSEYHSPGRRARPLLPPRRAPPGRPRRRRRASTTQTGTGPGTLCKNAAENRANNAKANGIQIATVYVLGGPSDGSTFLEQSIASDRASGGKLAFEDPNLSNARQLADDILDSISPCFSD